MLLWFLDRAALVHLNKTSLLHGSLCYTWRDTYNRCCQLASSLSKHCLSSTVHAFVLVIACYSCLSVWFPKKKKKGERKNYCSGVFHVALNILEMKRSNFLDFFFFFFEAIQSEINKYMVILVCAYRLAVLELYEC